MTRSAPRLCPLGLRQRVADVAARRAPRRQEAEGHGADDRDTEREEKHRPVHAHLAHAWQTSGLESEEELHPRGADDHTHDTAA